MAATIKSKVDFWVYYVYIYLYTTFFYPGFKKNCIFKALVPIYIIYVNYIFLKKNTKLNNNHINV